MDAQLNKYASIGTSQSSSEGLYMLVSVFLFGAVLLFIGYYIYCFYRGYKTGEPFNAAQLIDKVLHPFQKKKQSSIKGSLKKNMTNQEVNYRPPVQEVPKKVCPNCGMENDIDSTFCKNCGSRIG